MPEHVIGQLSSGDMPYDEGWILACYEWAIGYLQFVVGEPESYKLEVVWQDHELGSYPSLGVTWEDEFRAPPDEWIWKWEHALSEFDWAISWSKIKPETIESALEEMAQAQRAEMEPEDEEAEEVEEAEDPD